MANNEELEIYFYPAEPLKDEDGNELNQTQIKINPNLLETFMTGRFNLNPSQVEILRSLRELRGKQFFATSEEEEVPTKRAPSGEAPKPAVKPRLPEDRLAQGMAFSPRLRSERSAELHESVPMPKKNIKLDASALNDYISPEELERDL